MSLLGLPPLEVRFFTEATGRQTIADATLDMPGRKPGLRAVGGGWLDGRRLAGLTRGCEPGVVWLNADLPPLDLVPTFAHEARRRHQYQQGVMDGRWSREQAEADADRWADLFVMLLVAAGR